MTTMPVFHYLVVAVVMFVAGEVLISAWLSRQANHYARIAKTEKIRSQVADARYRLIDAATRGVIAPTSITFRELYFVQTSLMRGTDRYSALSEALWRKVLRFEQARQSAMLKEAESWTPEVRTIVIQTADAIRQIWIWYMPFGMFIRVVKHILIKIGVVSYERVEKWYDSVLASMVNVADAFARLVGAMTFAYLDAIPIGNEVRLAAEMRQAEQILRQVSRHAQAA